MLYQMFHDFIINSIFRDLTLTAQQTAFAEIACYFCIVALFVGIWKFFKGCFDLWRF